MIDMNLALSAVAEGERASRIDKRVNTSIRDAL